ncbi:hypothetical protein BGX28_000379 [Mortierella sp. GBA30]|nr:hypothetical protein BGX28_000379 [Mortierella sp. GBA30]
MHKELKESKSEARKASTTCTATLATKELALNLSRAWLTGLLLNLTQARTMPQAAQLGLFLFLGTYAPLVGSEYLWEGRDIDLQKIKLLSGLSSTVFLACLMHWIGTA